MRALWWSSFLVWYLGSPPLSLGLIVVAAVRLAAKQQAIEMSALAL
jgi:hypothetical protein